VAEQVGRCSVFEPAELLSRELGGKQLRSFLFYSGTVEEAVRCWKVRVARRGGGEEEDEE